MCECESPWWLCSTRNPPDPNFNETDGFTPVDRICIIMLIPWRVNVMCGEIESEALCVGLGAESHLGHCVACQTALPWKGAKINVGSVRLEPRCFSSPLPKRAPECLARIIIVASAKLMTQHIELRLKKFNKSSGAPLKLVRITCKQETLVVGISVWRLANIWFYQNYVGWKIWGFICVAHFKRVVNSFLVISGKQNILILLREFRDL